ncbi:MAG: hypothetical protein OXT70_00775 [Chloroflexota bacterium]|nr:hypothetical protein [Chloroflexota bacterium]
MPDTAVNPTSEVELKLPDDPRVTPLVRRLAIENWEIYRDGALRSGMPIVAAWMDIYVDREDRTLFFVAIHCDATRQETRDFRDSLSHLTQAWFDGLPEDEYEVASLIPFTFAGVKRDEQAVNGA